MRYPSHEPPQDDRLACLPNFLLAERAKDVYHVSSTFLNGLMQKAIRMSCNVALVTDIFARAGTQRVIATLANNLAEQGHSVGIYCLDRDGEATSWVSDSVEVLPIGRKPGKALDIACVKKLRRLLLERRVDIVQSHNWSTLLECSTVTALCGPMRHIYTEHGGKIINPKASVLKNRARRWLARILLLRADARIAIAQQLREQIAFESGLPIDLFEYIPNGIQIPRSSYGNPSDARLAIRTSLGIEVDGFVIGTIARLHEIKRLDWAIRAFAGCYDRMKRPYLLFVGDGQERSKLEKLSSDLGIQDRIFFVGEKSDIADWLACMDVFINSSRSEGMSISIMEAMACEIPILANDVGDNRLLVDGEGPAGLIVAPGDIPALSEAMTMLAADSVGRKKFSENGRERYLKYHSLPTMCGRYVDLYRRVLEARSR